MDSENQVVEVSVGEGAVQPEAVQLEAVEPECANPDVLNSAPVTAEGVTPDNTPSEAVAPVSLLSESERVGLIEALLLAHGDPLPILRLQEILNCSKDQVLSLVEILKANYAQQGRGLEIANISSKLQLRTKPVYAEYVRNLIAVKPRKLSQAALETLAVIAYQQPVVKSEIDKIRGVDVSPTIKTLLERNLVKILGYQPTVGQPALYGTTDDFLNIFGLGSLAELPALRDLKALVREPGEALEEGAVNESDSDESTNDVSANDVSVGTENGNTESAAQV